MTTLSAINLPAPVRAHVAQYARHSWRICEVSVTDDTLELIDNAIILAPPDAHEVTLAEIVIGCWIVQPVNGWLYKVIR